MKPDDPLSDRFRWHREALIPGAVRTEPAETSALDDRPGPAALGAALARAEAGLAFRLGGGDAPVPDGAVPMFETLTGGSTGAPRRIRRSQRSWIESFAVTARLFGVGPGTRVAVPGRLSHSLALYGAIEGAHLGAEVHLLDGMRPDRQAAALAALRIDVVYATPSQLRQMLGQPPVPSLRLAMIGGEMLDPSTRAGLSGVFPNADLRVFYGAAEASFITLSDTDTPERSVGRAYPGVEIALVEGEVHVRSPYLFQGYGGCPGHARWRDGLLSVGERGWMDDGHLFLAGRADRMVTVAGQNVFPEEVEAFLLSLAGVRRAAVFARPDAARGHVLEAVVDGGDADALIAACRRRLGPLKAPRRLHRTEHWPILASGKADVAMLARIIG